jgi:soluble lytic murein transglycosylase-like protein
MMRKVIVGTHMLGYVTMYTSSTFMVMDAYHRFHVRVGLWRPKLPNLILTYIETTPLIRTRSFFDD